MGGGEDRFLEGSVLGASFWRWWNRGWTGDSADVRRTEEQPPQTLKGVQPSEAISLVQSQELEVSCITSVVPRPRRPAKSEPIDIPIKKILPPVYEVAEDKRYWYQ